MRFRAICLVFLTLSVPVLAKKIEVTVAPSTARLLDKKTGAVLGVGTATLKVSRKDTVIVEAQLDGFAPVTKVINYDSPKKVKLLLDTRVVNCKIPAGATAKAGNATHKGPLFTLPVPYGQTLVLEVSKEGYQTVKRTYANVPGSAPAPPLSDSIELLQRVVHIKTEPADALLKVGGKTIDGGHLTLVLAKGETKEVTLEKRGWVTIRKTYQFLPGSKLPPTQDTLTLEDRLVHLTASPYDAKIFVNGKQESKIYVDLVIPKNEVVTLEVKKDGFRTLSRVLYNREGSEEPPEKLMLELKDRMVQLLSDRDTEFTIDGQYAGKGTVNVPIPPEQCVTVVASRPGYKEVERQYCNRSSLPAPPPHERVKLIDRKVSLNVEPPSSEIWVNGKMVGTGTADVIIPDGQSVTIKAKAKGFVSQSIVAHNIQNMSAPQPTQSLQLKVDQAFTSSSASDQANRNFTITVGDHHTEETAWKLLSQVIMNKFDLIELADRDTGYLRTAYSLQYFSANTIRTRVIVKSGNIDPLRYTVKIVSEESGAPRTKANEDESFKQWPRLLKTFDGVLDELQARLR